MKVRQVMRTEVVAISADSTYEEAAGVMFKHRFSGLPVVNGARELVGIISEKDLFRALYPGYDDYLANPELYHDQEEQEAEIEALRQSPVTKFMTGNVCTIDPEAPILKAGGLMLARGIHRLPVVEKGKLVGIVTRKEIYGAILEQRLGRCPRCGEALARAA